METKNMKKIIYLCIDNILKREKKSYAKLNEIYIEVAKYLEVENNKALQSQIRGRLQENCEQYSNFKGDPLFLTEKIRSGNWTIKKDLKKHIRYIKNTYLITEDNWRTVENVKSIDPEYILEENRDNIYKAKSTYELGTNKAKIIISELNEIRKLLKQLKNVDKENEGYGIAFEVFAVSTLHNIEYEECINKYIIHGDNDGVIDAIYYGEKNDVYIYQVKLNDFNDVRYELYDAMQVNYDKCIRNQIPENGKNLYNFVKENGSHWKDKKVNYRSVSKNSKKKTNFIPESIYKMFFENKMLPLNNNNLTLEIKKPKLDPDKPIYNVSTDGNKNFSFYIKAIDLKNALLEALGIDPNKNETKNVDLSKYFSDNVRGTLKEKEKMVETIKNEPENFIKYNNGINITGEVEDLRTKIQIKNPTINNGQQTITTIIRTNESLDKIMLMVKVTNETDMVIKSKISQFSNDQVKVKAIDMLSLNSFVRDIQKTIFENSNNDKNYFLEIYSSGKKNYTDIQKILYEKNNIINLLDFIKLYFSTKDSKNLGPWKNNPNTQIENTNINLPFDKDLSFRVCEATTIFNNYVDNVKEKKDKADFKSADLAFKYLICKENLNADDAAIIIKRINKKYFYSLKNEKSKLIDIYKSTNIIKKIDNELKLYRKEKKTKITV